VNTPHATCTKPGGVCSLQLYTDRNGLVEPVEGDKGMLRALCPYRFHQSNTVFQHIGERLLGDPMPALAGEVGFLESTGNLDSAQGEDVGRIDMILVKSNAPDSQPMQWAAVEIQAVYFSGREMSIEFRHIAEAKGAVSMAQEARRPDYRSSGPKRLMPQLQIKVPTLRRWGKKMAIVVDMPFFQSMGAMQTVPHVSNADIVWFLVDFVDQKGVHEKVLTVVQEVYTTLESSIEGLTGGTAVSLDEFEARIKSKTDGRQVVGRDQL
jgi:Restriction endonuclease NotI